MYAFAKTKKDVGTRSDINVIYWQKWKHFLANAYIYTMPDQKVPRLYKYLQGTSF